MDPAHGGQGAAPHCGIVGRMNRDELPKYVEIILPAVRAVATLGGSASAQEIVTQVIDDEEFTEDMLAIEHAGRPGASVLVERVMWARSYAKLIGALESPKRGIFLVTPLGRGLLEMPQDAAQERVRELDRDYRRNRPKKQESEPPSDPTVKLDVDGDDDVAPDDDESADESTPLTTSGVARSWKDMLLDRLHRLDPTAFEEFVLYLLRLYGLQLERVGGTGDEGIDGIGTAPISAVLSSRVAIQVKRWDPAGRSVGREVVALFQRDAQTKGAERAILVTLGKFSEPARKAAIVTSPTVDLIDGDRLADLVKEQGLGVKMITQVDPAWFDRFD